MVRRHEEMLDTEDPDVLSICTPSGAHLEPTVAAAEQEIDILCEKPLEITTERIDRMRDVVEGNNADLYDIFLQQYNPVVH